MTPALHPFPKGLALTATYALDDTARDIPYGPIALPPESTGLTARQRLVLLDLKHASRDAAEHDGWVPYRHADVGRRLGISARTVGIALHALQRGHWVEYRAGRGDAPSMARTP